MKRKNGFTLIELLAVITILAIILAIAIPVVINNINVSKSKSYDNQTKLIVESTKKYIAEAYEDIKWENDNGILKTVISLRKLDQEGYMDLPVLNPITGNPFDPDTTVVTVYKDSNGDVRFEFEAEDDVDILLINGSKNQTISRSIEYDSTMILSDIYGKDENKLDISNEITYECQFEGAVINCSVLSDTEKDTGIYIINYTLRTKTETRQITVVDLPQPIIILRPANDGITKVDSVQVTINYPAKTRNQTYTTASVTNEPYVRDFTVTSNQTITATCITETGLRCKTATAVVSNIRVQSPTITTSTTPSTLVSGYATSETATVKYNVGGIANPIYYVKSTKAATSSLNIIGECGESTLPGNCSTVSTNSISANKWYKLTSTKNANTETVTYNTSGESGTIYAVTSDGISYSDVTNKALQNIDASAPDITINTLDVKTDRATLDYTIVESGVGIKSITCKYGENTSYSTTVNDATESSCTMTNLVNGHTYYYQLCAEDLLGNKDCRTGSTDPATITNPRIVLSTTPATLQNGYYKEETASITFDNTAIYAPQYYIRTTKTATLSSGTLSQMCDSDSHDKPTNCQSASGTSLSANKWYRVSGNVEVIYNTTSSEVGTLYAVTYDGTSYSTAATATIDKIDIDAPTVAANGNPTTTYTSITIPTTITDTESGYGSTTCVYGTTTSYGTNCNTKTQSQSTITGLNPGTEYFFKICATDGVGNTTADQNCYKSSATTSSSLSGNITITASWPNTTSMDLTLSGVTSSNNLEYRCVVGSIDTGWQSSSTCSITGLSGGTAYTVTAYVRDAASQIELDPKTTTIYTAKEVVASSAITQNSTCQTPTPTTPISGDEIYDSVTLTGTCTQGYYSCSQTYSSAASASLKNSSTSSVFCYGTNLDGEGGTLIRISGTRPGCAISSSAMSYVSSCPTSSRSVSCDMDSCSYYSSLVSTKSVTTSVRIACNGASIYIYPISYRDESSSYHMEWSYYLSSSALSGTQGYKTCSGSTTSCYLTSFQSSNTTGCGGTKTSICNGSTITLSSSCGQYNQTSCCNSVGYSSYDNTYSNTYSNCAWFVTSGGPYGTGSLWEIGNGTQCAATTCCASVATERARSASWSASYYCVRSAQSGQGSCSSYTTTSMWYSTRYSFSSSWSNGSGYYVSYSASRLDVSTLSYYYRTYYASIPYASYSYYASIAYPKQSLY